MACDLSNSGQGNISFPTKHGLAEAKGIFGIIVLFLMHLSENTNDVLKVAGVKIYCIYLMLHEDKFLYVLKTLNDSSC